MLPQTQTNVSRVAVQRPVPWSQRRAGRGKRSAQFPPQLLTVPDLCASSATSNSRNSAPFPSTICLCHPLGFAGPCCAFVLGTKHLHPWVQPIPQAHCCLSGTQEQASPCPQPFQGAQDELLSGTQLSSRRIEFANTKPWLLPANSVFEKQ